MPQEPLGVNYSILNRSKFKAFKDSVSYIIIKIAVKIQQFYIIYVQKPTSAVRETDVSRHNGEPN